MHHAGNAVDARERDSASRLEAANILLHPNQLFSTDFGISRDRRKEERSTTEYHVGFSYGYAAPEVVGEEKRNARETDIYSLGCVFLHILTAVYDGPERQFHNYLARGPNQNVRAYREQQFVWYLRYVVDHKDLGKAERLGRSCISTLYYGSFLGPIFNSNRKMRPTILQIGQALRSLGGEDCVYYGRCCTYSTSIGQISNAENQDVIPRVELPLNRGKVSAS